jgi:hypothetical protein
VIEKYPESSTVLGIPNLDMPRGEALHHRQLPHTLAATCMLTALYTLVEMVPPLNCNLLVLYSLLARSAEGAERKQHSSSAHTPAAQQKHTNTLLLVHDTHLVPSEAQGGPTLQRCSTARLQWLQTASPASLMPPPQSALCRSCANKRTVLSTPRLLKSQTTTPSCTDPCCQAGIQPAPQLPSWQDARMLQHVCAAAGYDRR